MGKEQMKKIGFLLVIVTILITIGCGSIDRNNEENGDEGVIYSEIDVDSIKRLSGVDNTIDKYTAKTNTKIEIDEPKGEIGGGYDFCISSSKAIVLKKHLFKTPEESYDQIISINKNGEIETENRSLKNQIIDLGACAHNGSHVEINMSSDKGRYGIIKTLEGGVEAEISLENVGKLDENSMVVYASAVDGDGNLHVCLNYYDGTTKYYCIIDKSGNILHTESVEGLQVIGIETLADGRVAVVIDAARGSTADKEDESKWVVWNGSSLEEEYLFSWPSNLYDFSYYPVNNENVIYADNNGVYSCDYDFNEKEMLYQFSNHGIRAEKIVKICPQDEGIGVLYISKGELYYLYIEPVQEKLEIRQIIIAVSPQMKNIYKEAVTEFNKQYPTCNIQIEEYSETIGLNTELIAGSGPVLIDTNLTGFSNHVEMWEPLDKVLEDLNIADELDQRAMELGKIGGVTLGVCTNYYIETVVAKKEYNNWNYKRFIELINNENIKFISNSEYASNDREKIISKFFLHSLNDSYFIDFGKKKTIFSTKEGKKILNLVKDKQPVDEQVPLVEGLYEGGVLCNQITIGSPKELAAYRMIYGDDLAFIGYPYEEGAYSIISSSAPLAIRKNATKEEKELACVFMGTLLSYESQINMAEDRNFGFSVRKDVLDFQFENIDFAHEIYISQVGNVMLDSSISYGNREAIDDILKAVKADNVYSKAMIDVIFEEITDYFSDRITVDEATKNLTNRVELMLNEIAD